MLKFVLSLCAVVSIFASSIAFAGENVSVESQQQQIETMQAVVVQPFMDHSVNFMGCPKGYVVARKRCWVNWRLVNCGTYCNKIPSPPCCHGEGKPQ
jgi:hypothetical protein